MVKELVAKPCGENLMEKGLVVMPCGERACGKILAPSILAANSFEAASLTTTLLHLTSSSSGPHIINFNCCIFGNNRLPICWEEIRDRALLGPEIVE